MRARLSNERLGRDYGAKASFIFSRTNSSITARPTPIFTWPCGVIDMISP